MLSGRTTMVKSKIRPRIVYSTTDLPPASRVWVRKVTAYYRMGHAEADYESEFGVAPTVAWKWEDYVYFEKPKE